MALLDRIDAQIHIGPRVRALREAMDLSLRDLAERSGVSAPMLSQVERGGVADERLGIEAHGVAAEAAAVSCAATSARRTALASART